MSIIKQATHFAYAQGKKDWSKDTYAEFGGDIGKVDTPKLEKKPEVKPVSGAKQPEKRDKPKKEKAVDILKAEEHKEEKTAEDLSWMG